MLTQHRRQQGVTLVELLVASAISLIALATVLTTYAATARHSTLQLQSAHLHQQLYGIVHLISRDLRRAGYWHFDAAVLSPAANPFQQGGNRLRTAALAGESANSCILLAYDLDHDGKVGVGQCVHGHCAASTDADNVEQFGFRLRQQTLQARYGGSTLACDTGYWQAVNDPDIEITRLQFELHEHCINLAHDTRPCKGGDASLQQRVVSIDIGARLRNQPDSAIRLQRQVAVRNDRLQEAAP
jgi:prepilin peptidase dependent protein B